jgi:FlaA1/EpsC-like NDP-sugar epimerase
MFSLYLIIYRPYIDYNYVLVRWGYIFPSRGSVIGIVTTVWAGRGPGFESW